MISEYLSFLFWIPVDENVYIHDFVKSYMPVIPLFHLLTDSYHKDEILCYHYLCYKKLFPVKMKAYQLTLDVLLFRSPDNSINLFLFIDILV